MPKASFDVRNLGLILAPRRYPWVRWISIQGRVGFCEVIHAKQRRAL